ncbi:MAG: OFA family MFS transporter [Spirochaetes bacterium]|nr:OFA family MFS transporter [Spirochaetota bacterium]
MVERSGRWLIAIMGTILMLCLGTVYAWSFFQDLLVRQYHDLYGWSNSQVAWVFSLAIFFLGVTAAWGGTQLPKIGPRRMAMLGGLLFSAGYLVAGAALQIRSLALLYVGYGALGGIGLGLGYVTPVATISKWFPDRKGLATGMVIMGFGLGALLMSKVLAPLLLDLTGSLVSAFLLLGAVFFVFTVGPAAFMRNPEKGWLPAGYSPPAAASKGPASSSLTPRGAVFSGRFALMWLVFFCNITAGIAIIGFQSPLLQSLWKKADPSLPEALVAGFGATLIAVSSLFNGAGRFFWGAVSDRIGREQTFRIMLGSEIVVFVALVLTGSPWLFAVLVCWVLLCYGGGFGTMPAFVSDTFGQHIMAPVYGAILTAWSAAGIVGPQIVAILKDRVPDRASFLSFIVGACFLAVGFALSLAIPGKPSERRPS